MRNRLVGGALSLPMSIDSMDTAMASALLPGEKKSFDEEKCFIPDCRPSNSCSKTTQLIIGYVKRGCGMWPQHPGFGEISGEISGYGNN